MLYSILPKMWRQHLCSVYRSQAFAYAGRTEAEHMYYVYTLYYTAERKAAQQYNANRRNLLVNSKCSQFWAFKTQGVNYTPYIQIWFYRTFKYAYFCYGTKN